MKIVVNIGLGPSRNGENVVLAIFSKKKYWVGSNNKKLARSDSLRFTFRPNSYLSPWATHNRGVNSTETTNLKMNDELFRLTFSAVILQAVCFSHVSALSVICLHFFVLGTLYVIDTVTSQWLLKIGDIEFVLMQQKNIIL